MFYVVLFSVLAVLLVVAGVTARARQRHRWEAEEHDEAHRRPEDRRATKAKRRESRNARRKRA